MPENYIDVPEEEWYNFKIRYFDSETSLPVVASSVLTDSANPSDPNTNGTTSEKTESNIPILYSSNNLRFINIETTSFGYEVADNLAVFTPSENVYVYDVNLTKLPTVDFSCTTTPKSSSGYTTNRILKEGYLEVTFTANAPFNLNDYTASFEAFVGGNKRSGVYLKSKLISNTSNSVTYHVNLFSSKSNVCYLSNFIKNQC